MTHPNKMDVQESKLAAIAARKAELRLQPTIIVKRVILHLGSQSTSSLPNASIIVSSI